MGTTPRCRDYRSRYSWTAGYRSRQYRPPADVRFLELIRLPTVAFGVFVHVGWSVLGPRFSRERKFDERRRSFVTFWLPLRLINMGYVLKIEKYERHVILFIKEKAMKLLSRTEECQAQRFSWAETDQSADRAFIGQNH